jgi:hypothetical protein
MEYGPRKWEKECWKQNAFLRNAGRKEPTEEDKMNEEHRLSLLTCLSDSQSCHLQSLISVYSTQNMPQIFLSAGWEMQAQHPPVKTGLRTPAQGSTRPQTGGNNTQADVTSIEGNTHIAGGTSVPFGFVPVARPSEASTYHPCALVIDRQRQWQSAAYSAGSAGHGDVAFVGAIAGAPPARKDCWIARPERRTVCACYRTSPRKRCLRRR